MKIKGTRKLTLPLVVISFGFWISAILTPSWVSWSVYYPLPNKPEKEMMIWESTLNHTLLHYYNIFFNDYVQSYTFEDIQGNAYYLEACTYHYPNRNCKRFPLNRNITNLVHSICEMIGSVAVLGLCIVSFFLILLKSGSSHKVLAAGISMFLAALLEFLVIISWIETDSKGWEFLKRSIGETDKVAYEHNFPYSIFLAGESLFFSILAMYSIFVLFKKLNKEIEENLINDL